MSSAFTQGILATPLPVALGGTGLSTLGSALQVVRVNAGATALEYATIGALSDGNKGDITVSASGATWTINDNAVTNAKINDSAVTFAKMQNISGTTLVGRHAGGSGAIQEVSVGNGLEFSGSGIRRSALTGDITASAGSNTTTLATVNSNVGSFGSATQASTFTVNAKGLITAASNVTVTPAVGSITGLGTGVATALAINTGSAGAFVTFNGALGTPLSGTVTNLTGTASININGTVGATTPNTGSFTTVTTTGNIELGNASDTTVSRASAGVVAVEGNTLNGYISNSDGATITFNIGQANKHTVTLGGNRTLAVSGVVTGQVFLIRLVQDGTGSRVATLFSGISWAGGTAPTQTTTPNKADVFGFLCTGVGAYAGFVIGQNI